MAINNQEKYSRYKKRQEALGKKQISITLDEDLATTFQNQMKGDNRFYFENQLKSYFLSKKSLELKNKLAKKQINDKSLYEIIRNIDNILPEIEEDVAEMDIKIKNLYKKLQNFVDGESHCKNQTSSDKVINNPENQPKLTQNINQRKKHKIPVEVLNLARNLYKSLKSWRKVSQELANLGYFSCNNNPYTSSAISRAVRNYKS